MRGNMREKVKLLKNGLKIGAAVAAMALAVCVGNKSVAYADGTSGVDGGVKWEITGDTLKIEPAGDDDKESGYDDGKMKDYSCYPTASDANANERPEWGGVAYDSVTKIVIADGVKNIGAKAFGSTYANYNKKITTVVIGKDVESIGSLAFGNTAIPDLTIYSNISKDKIDNMAFMSKTATQDELELKVSKVNCYVDGVSLYFKQFTNDDPLITVSEGKYKKSDVSINNFNIKIESDNLLASDADVSILWDRDGLSTSQTAEESTLSISPSKLALFTDKGMDLTKLKFFTLSQTDDNAPINKAQITIPTPSGWKDHHDKIELYSYTISDDNTLELKKLDSAINDKDIIFTGEGFPVNYILYYNYNSNPEYKVLIDTQYFDNEVFYWGIAGGSLTYGIPTKTDTTISEIITKFVAANTANSSGYTFDNNKLKTFDLSLTADGTAVTTVPTNMRVKIPLPDGWDSADVQVLTLSSDSKIEVVNSITVTSIGSKLYVDFMPSHFSPYALYNAKAGTETTTATTTAAATTTTAVNTTTRANTVSTTNSNYNNSSTSYNGSGRYDNTPKTGVKDFMWIAIPVAVMLMGIGIVILGRRKQRSIDE